MYEVQGIATPILSTSNVWSTGYCNTNIIHFKCMKYRVLQHQYYPLQMYEVQGIATQLQYYPLQMYEVQGIATPILSTSNVWSTGYCNTNIIHFKCMKYRVLQHKYYPLQMYEEQGIATQILSTSNVWSTGYCNTNINSFQSLFQSQCFQKLFIGNLCFVFKVFFSFV